MSKRLENVKRYVINELRYLANKCQAFRGTIHDFHINHLSWFEYNAVYSAIMELIDEKEILYIKDDDVYTLILKEKDMEEE